jgi:hypothetical protein
MSLPKELNDALFALVESAMPGAIDDVFEVFIKRDLTVDQAGMLADAVLTKIRNLPIVQERTKEIKRVKSLADFITMNRKPWPKIAPDMSGVTDALGVKAPGCEKE